MLNRRALRIKAMQNVFAFEHCKESNYHISVDSIKQTFEPDKNSMEPQDLGTLQSNKEAAITLFEKNYENETTSDSYIVGNDEVKKAVLNAINLYHRQVRKDFVFFKKHMVAEVEKISDRYLLMLLLLVELADLVQWEHEEKKNRLSKQATVPSSELNLYNNKVINILKNNTFIHAQYIKRNVNWANKKDIVIQIYREAIKKDDVYNEYRVIKDPTFEDDKTIINHLIKNVVFKTSIFNSFMEDNDLNWSENKIILKSMVAKTVKSITPENQSLELLELSSNWEEDKIFFEDVFTLTIRDEVDHDEVIAKKAKNWDIDRIALLDKIILRMSITEMINFPSIPIKVTINEYLEISKDYSTPKSRQFINGLLDVIATDLTKKGVIRKSGRGLIDNR